MYKKLHWTQHVRSKMRQYRLSKSRLIRLLDNPKREEEGIASGTIAIMQPVSRKKHTSEVWLMYQDTQKTRKIITAWRYPGVSPVGEKLPIPEDIRLELIKNKNYEL